MYILLVLGMTVVLPIASGIIELLVTGGDPVLIFGKWFLFWGVGVRLFTAGISQITRPQFTIKTILGEENAGASQIAQELGFANTAIGLGGLVATWVPEWWVPVAGIGALFIGMAGIRHVPKKNPNSKEKVATWSDLFVAVVLAVFVIALVVKGLALG